MKQDKPSPLTGQRIALPERAEPKAKIVRLSEVTPKPLRPLWPGRFYEGKPSLIAGDPGLGKSLITIDMAARVSTGKLWPDLPDRDVERGGVVILSAEDDVDDTICPRLLAAGADLSRIVAIQGIEFHDEKRAVKHRRSFSLEHDDRALEDAMREVENCRLVLVDPISAYLGKVDSHRNSDVRAVLAVLADLAARHGVAVVAVTHLTKAYGGKAMYRATGSLAFTAAARSSWLVTADRNDPERRLMLGVKSNLAQMPDGLAYRIASKSLVGVEHVPYLLWDTEPVTMTANEALAAEVRQGRDRTEGRVEAGIRWLQQQLANGPVPSRELEKRAQDAGVSWASVRQAQGRLKIKPRKTGFCEPWLWELPKEATPNSEDAQPIDVSTFAASERRQDEETAFPAPPAEGAQDAQARALSTFEDGEQWGEL